MAVSRGCRFQHYDLMLHKHSPVPPCKSLGITEQSAYYVIKPLAKVVLSILHNWKVIATLNFAF